MAAVELDPFSPTFFDDPYDTYTRLRDEAAVFFSEKYRFYALSRYADVVAAHKDWATFSSAHGVDLTTLSTDPELVASLRSIIMMDPPAHDRFRALVSRVFTPRPVQAMEPIVRRVIGDHLDALNGRTTFDAVGELSGPFPVEIIAEMLGVPEADRQQIRHWVDVMLHREPGEMRPTRAGIEASMSIGGSFLALAADKRSHPGDDLTSRLTQVTVDRGDGEPTGLDDIEIAGFAALLGGVQMTNVAGFSKVPVVVG
jgi:cytochrome P450